MTRQEWFDKQTPKVQKQFKNNCNLLNGDKDSFDYWINPPAEETEGIGGAFVWMHSEQGQEYWSKINKEYLKEVGDEE